MEYTVILECLHKQVPYTPCKRYPLSMQMTFSDIAKNAAQNPGKILIP